MKKQVKLWSAKEDSIIIEEINESPQNLAEAFVRASRRLGIRSASACGNRYYTSIRANTPVVVTATNTKQMINQKIVRRNTVPQISMSQTIEFISSLSPEKQKLIRDFLDITLKES